MIQLFIIECGDLRHDPGCRRPGPSSGQRPPVGHGDPQAHVEKSLFTFNAKDPVGILRSALRKHLAAHGGQGQPAARVRLIDRDRYVLA
jgi:hypothetical protein